MNINVQEVEEVMSKARGGREFGMDAGSKVRDVENGCTVEDGCCRNGCEVGGAEIRSRMKLVNFFLTCCGVSVIRDKNS